MKKISRTLFAFTVLVLIFGMMSFSVFATKEEFTAKVNGIDTAKNYGERFAYLQDAEKIYMNLTEAEKSEVNADYNKLLAEKKAIEEIAVSAKEFIRAVTAINEYVSLADKETAVNNIEEKLLFEDVSYPGVSDALDSFNKAKDTVTEAVENCYKFMELVDELSLINESDYIELKRVIEEGSKLFENVDTSYPGVRSAKNIFDSINDNILKKEIYTKSVLNMIKELDSLTSYKYKKEQVKNIKNFMNNEDFLKDYKGMSEGLVKLAEVEEYMRECIKKANKFIVSVDAIDDAPNVGEGLIAARDAFRGVDKTVEGVRIAKTSYDEQLKSYNEIVKKINKIQTSL